MPADYRIHPNIFLKFVRIWGHTELSELLALATRYSNDPRCDLRQRQLVDLGALTDAKATFSDVFALHGFYARTFGQPEKPINVAISAPTGLGYGLSHMFTALTGGQQLMRVEIFRSLPEAAMSLSIDAQTLGGIERELTPNAT